MNAKEYEKDVKAEKLDYHLQQQELQEILDKDPEYQRWLTAIQREALAFQREEK